MHGRKILLAVSGSIACYKAVLLARLLVKEGAELQVLMTPAATQFVTPLTFATLTHRPVLTEIISEQAWNNHVELGLWADAMIVAPATANTLAKMANGICDNIVTAVYLSARCPVFFAPAMDLDMWTHPATRQNVEKLVSFGNIYIPVEYGELASGLLGEGRMAEPENILAFVRQHLEQTRTMQSCTAVVTAGPTFEPIDPVRFIGNHSSGKMGIAIANELARRGCHVHLILGPSREPLPQSPNIEVHRVMTAEEMHDRALVLFPKADLAVLAAAVADYRPKNVEEQKIKKSDEAFQLALEKTPDIAASLGKMKRPDQFIVGFALETENELENAREKLHKKNFDFIVLNSLRDPGAGFNHPTNKITILDKDNSPKKFELKTKAEAARDIVDEIVARMSKTKR